LGEKRLNDGRLSDAGLDSDINSNKRGIIVLPTGCRSFRRIATLPVHFKIYGVRKGDGIEILPARELAKTAMEDLIAIDCIALQFKGVGDPFYGIQLDQNAPGIIGGPPNLMGASDRLQKEMENDRTLLKNGARMSTIMFSAVELLNQRQFPGMLVPSYGQYRCSEYR